MAKRWMCVFEGRTGAGARAEFATKEEAWQCAERHARATTAGEICLKWEDRADAAVARTLLGYYLVRPTSDGAQASIQNVFGRSRRV
jgi:hypothetical protein